MIEKVMIENLLFLDWNAKIYSFGKNIIYFERIENFDRLTYRLTSVCFSLCFKSQKSTAPKAVLFLLHQSGRSNFSPEGSCIN